MKRRTIIAALALLPVTPGRVLAECYGDFRDDLSTRSRLMLRHPHQNRVVVFTHRRTLADGGDSCDAAAWRKVEILSHTGGLVLNTVVGGYDPEDKATLFLPDTDVAQLWSPDGRYLTIFRLSDDGAGHMVREFLDVDRATWAAFLTEDEKAYATTDNFQGWAGDAPHTALLMSNNAVLPMLRASPVD